MRQRKALTEKDKAPSLYEYEKAKRQAADLIPNTRKNERQREPTNRNLTKCSLHDPDDFCRLSKKPRSNGHTIYQQCNGIWWESCDIKMKEVKNTNRWSGRSERMRRALL
jgi:hypothetical protein